MVITSTEDVASVHGSFPSALCNEDRPIREVGAGVARLCAVSQLTTGYRGNRNWRDMSEYAVHFTKPAATSSPYDVMIKILWEGRINAVTPLGAARKLAHLGDSQKTACFSEIPLDLLGRLIERRSLYGIGFRQDFLVAHGGARVWYLDKDGPAAASFNALLAPAITSGVDANDPVWRITPSSTSPARTAQRSTGSNGSGSGACPAGSRSARRRGFPVHPGGAARRRTQLLRGCV